MAGMNDAPSSPADFNSENGSRPAERALQRALKAVPLASATGTQWCATAEHDTATLLEDHCQCELKAASNALALIGRNPEKNELVERMQKLAKEELQHYEIVRQLMANRGMKHHRPQQSPYMKGLNGGRQGGAMALLDSLLISAVVEARSCERFLALTQAFRRPAAESAGSRDETLACEELAQMYENLARSESGHAWVFVELARLYYDPELVETELGRWVAHEAKVLESVPLTARMHGGNPS